MLFLARMLTVAFLALVKAWHLDDYTLNWWAGPHTAANGVLRESACSATCA